MELSKNLSFPIDVNETIVNITIIDNNNLESNEKYFLAILSEVSMTGEMMPIANVTVTIEGKKVEYIINR